jgi:hypothetical protein
MWIEIPPSGQASRQIRRADFVDYEHTITSVPIQSGMAEKMTSLLLKLAALLLGGEGRPCCSAVGRRWHCPQQKL